MKAVLGRFFHHLKPFLTKNISQEKQFYKQYIIAKLIQDPAKALLGGLASLNSA